MHGRILLWNTFGTLDTVVFTFRNPPADYEQVWWVNQGDNTQEYYDAMTTSTTPGRYFNRTVWDKNLNVFFNWDHLLDDEGGTLFKMIDSYDPPQPPDFDTLF